MKIRSIAAMTGSGMVISRRSGTTVRW